MLDNDINGITIRMKDRSGIVYEMSDDFLEIGGEILVNPIGFIISESSIKKWTKSGKIISEDEKEKIIKNIEEYFFKQGASLVLV